MVQYKALIAMCLIASINFQDFKVDQIIKLLDSFKMILSFLTTNLH